MNNHLFREEFKPFGFSPRYQKLSSTENVSVDGILTQQSVFVESDNTSISKFKSSDFAFSNIIATGAFGSLNPISMSIDSDLNFVDSFAETFKDVKKND